MSPRNSLQVRIAQATRIVDFVRLHCPKILNQQTDLAVVWVSNRVVQRIGGIGLAIHSDNLHEWSEARVVSRRPEKYIIDCAAIVYVYSN